MASLYFGLWPVASKIASSIFLYPVQRHMLPARHYVSHRVLEQGFPSARPLPQEAICECKTRIAPHPIQWQPFAAGVTPRPWPALLSSGLSLLHRYLKRAIQQGEVQKKDTHIPYYCSVKQNKCL